MQLNILNKPKYLDKQNWLQVCDLHSASLYHQQLQYFSPSKFLCHYFLEYLPIYDPTFSVGIHKVHNTLSSQSKKDLLARKTQSALAKKNLQHHPAQWGRRFFLGLSPFCLELCLSFHIKVLSALSRRPIFSKNLSPQLPFPQVLQPP